MLDGLHLQVDCAKQCRALNASLICIASEAENNFIDSSHRDADVWLGLYHSKDIESVTREGWRWDSGCESTYRAWGLNEPMRQEYFTRSDCTRMRRGNWMSEPCNLPSSCLCELSLTSKSSSRDASYPPPWIESPPMHIGTCWMSALSVALGFVLLSGSIVLVDKCCNQSLEEGELSSDEEKRPTRELI